MTAFALHGFVSTGEWELRLIVVKGGSQPTACAVAHTTVARKTSVNVAGVCRAVVLLGVAAVAARRRSAELAVEVASSAIQLCVHPRQCETREF